MSREIRYKEKKNAQRRVKKSPRLKFSPISEKTDKKDVPLLDKNIKPAITSTVPTILPNRGGFRSIINWKNGVKRTKEPVINPDFVAVVKFNPIVCVEKPRK